MDAFNNRVSLMMILKHIRPDVYLSVKGIPQAYILGQSKSWITILDCQRFSLLKWSLFTQRWATNVSNLHKIPPHLSRMKASFFLLPSCSQLWFERLNQIFTFWLTMVCLILMWWVLDHPCSQVLITCPPQASQFASSWSWSCLVCIRGWPKKIH